MLRPSVLCSFKRNSWRHGLDKHAKSRVDSFRSLKDCRSVGIKSDYLKRIVTSCEAVGFHFTVINIIPRQHIIRHKFFDLLVSQRVYQ